MLKKASIKKKDKVKVIAGKDKGQTGIVLNVDMKKERVLVEGINMVKKHLRSDQSAGISGGIEDREASIAISNLMVICPECGKPTRIGKKILKDNRKVRVCKLCNGIIDK